MDSDSVAASVVSDHPQALELDQASDNEWDELASDIEEDPIERIPGESLLPSLRLENIIKADGMMGSLALSKEGLFILSVATEEFIKRLAQGGHRQASAERRTCVDYRDMAATTQQYQEFMFLQETVPFPVSLKEALEQRERKLKGLVADNPALITPTNFPANGTTPPTYKPKVKSRPNGKEKQSRHASSSRSESRAHSQVRWDYRDMPPSNGASQVPVSALSTRGGLDPANGWHRWANEQNVFAADVPHNAPHNPHNGTSVSTSSANGRTPPPRPGDTQLSSVQLATNYWHHTTWSKPPLDSSRPDSISNGHITLPQSQADSSATQTSGSVLAPDNPSAAGSSSGGLGGSSLVSENPGRTIYSQTKPFQTTQ